MTKLWDTVAHLKDIAAILTPIAIAIFGLYINKNIQTQNKIAERRSALSKQWADEFSKLTGEVYNTTLRIMFIYFEAKYYLDLVSEDEKKELLNKLNSEIREIGLRLEEQRLRLGHYIDLAPVSGLTIKQAFANLQEAARGWLNDQGGNADKLQELQTIFNRAARASHREMLALGRE